MSDQTFYSSFDYPTKTLNANWTVKQMTATTFYLNSQTFATNLFPDYKWTLSYKHDGSNIFICIRNQNELNTIKVNYTYIIKSLDRPGVNAVNGKESKEANFRGIKPEEYTCEYYCSASNHSSFTFKVSIQYLNGYVGFNHLNSPPTKEDQICYNHLFESDLYSDFELVINNKKLRVHKKIIANKCDYFRALIDSNMKETQNNQLIVEEFKYETMWHFIRFLYTGVIAVYHVPLALDLYKLAHKYNEDELKDDCIEFIVDWIKSANLITVLITGHYYEETKLFEAAMRLFKANKGKVLKDFEQFDLIAEYSQSADFYQKVVGNLNGAE